MSNGAVNFFIDATDDPLLPDGIPSFDGGQFSNLRANLLQQNQSTLLENCDIDKLGKLRTRRGTIVLGTGEPPTPSGTGNIIQGLTSYQTPDANYIVAAENKNIWKFSDPGWTKIATGGVADNDEVLIYRTGQINNTTGYELGATVLTVDTITGIVGGGEKLYFTNNLRTDWWEYTIASYDPAGVPTPKITLEEPGLVFDVKDNWKFVVARKAFINHADGYAPGYTGALVIDQYGFPAGGTVNVGETFVIKSENVRHVVTAASGTPTTSITSGTVHPALESDYSASDADVPVVFAQGNDMLYFCDGVGPIYGWNGQNLMNLSQLNTLDYLTGSTLHQERTDPPTGCKILVWFQNRLIASGIDAEPDAIYFSDFFDGTSWDRDYQKVRIGGGESDPITGLLAWTDYNLLVFKKNSIYVINLDPNQNQNPDDPTLLVASYSVKQIHKKIGCPAPKTAVQVGGGSTTPGSDVFFLDGDKKVHSIRRVLAAENQQEMGSAMSLPMQDVFDTIDIDHIDTACATYHNEHYLIAIPSLQGVGGGVYPNLVIPYNLLTQSWCGKWRNWTPTCFAMRTDLGSYSKMIFGQSDVDIGAGYVLQWLDDVGLEEEIRETYQDWGQGISTQILTRAITFGDYYSFKTGLSVEFEFDESVTANLAIKVILDKVEHPDPLTLGFITTLSEHPLTLPFTIPVTLPGTPGMLRMSFDLQRYGTWRELQFLLTTVDDKLSIRSIRVTGFMDTITLQTIPL